MEPDAKKDFDADKLLQEHVKDISSLSERVAALEGKLDKPEQLAATLEAATSDSKKLDKLFSKLFCDMMDKDPDVKKAVENKLDSIDRAAVNSVMKKFGGKIGFAVWSIFLIIVTAWAAHHWPIL